MKISILKSVQKDLNLDDDFLKRILDRKSNDIIYHKIPKRNGGFRIAKEIKIEFKPIQYWLLKNFFTLFPVSNNAHAYEINSNILKNATIHKNNEYFLKLDLKDFFPSIDFQSFERFLNDNKLYFDEKYTISEKDLLLLKNCCFDEKNVLAQGFSTSPVIANRILYTLDNAINEIISEFKNTTLVYTRYSDDLIISCNNKGLSYKIFKRVSELISKWEYPKLVLNQDKISFGSVGRGNVLVTGLKISRNHEVDITRKKKDELRLLLSLLKKGTLDKNDYMKLKGNIEFVRYNSPQFYTQLCIKYHFELIELNSFLVKNNNPTTSST